MASALARRCAPVPMPSTASGIATIAATVRRGLSDEYGILEHRLDAPRQALAVDGADIAAGDEDAAARSAPAARAACGRASTCRSRIRRRSRAPRPCSTVRSTPTTACSTRLPPVRPPPDREVAREAAGFEQRRHAASMGAAASTQRQSWDAGRVQRYRRGAGRACACAQRSRNAQPRMSPISDGTVPGMAPSRSPGAVRPGTGIDASRPRV